MKKIVHIISSASGEGSYSTRLGKATIEKLTDKFPGSSIVERNLITDAIPHLEMSHLMAFNTPAEQHTEELSALATYSKEAIDQVMESDIVVISVPMINFSIPSQLKAWIDQIARAGLTFKYDENGPQGLVKNKKVYLTLATGAIYSEGPFQAYDFIEPYLRGVLGFIGMTDITVLRVEGTSMPHLKDTALELAVEKIELELEEVA